MLIILLLALAILAPRLPLIGQKVLIGVAVVPIVFGLFYMIVAPGWVPGNSGRVRRALRMALFLGLAAAIVAERAALFLDSAPSTDEVVLRRSPAATALAAVVSVC